MERRSYRRRGAPQGRSFAQARAAVIVSLGIMVGTAACGSDSAPQPTSMSALGLRAAAREAAWRSARRVHAVLINGGDRPERNYQSHELHINELKDLLIAQGVRRRNIVVFASDGTDPAADVAVLDERAGRMSWLLTGTTLGSRLRPEVRLADSRIEGVKRLPATRRALSAWFETKASGLKPGSVLLIYVTDHGSKNPVDLRNNSLLLWGESLDVAGLSGLLRHVPADVRTVMLMSQCFSGSFTNVLSGDERAMLEGNLCGFFSSPADRPAYGCYPENRGKENIGHSFEFFDALRAVAAFDRAHEEVLLIDDTPDVPNRSSGYWLDALLRARAEAFSLPYEAFADSFIEKAWLDEALYGETFARIDRLGGRFGSTAPRTLAELRERTEGMPQVRNELRAYARRWDDAFRALKEANVARFLEANSEWNDRLASAGRLDGPRTSERRILRGALLRKLARFTAADRATADRLRALRAMAREAEAGAYRMDVRLAVASRMRDMLVRVAGEVFLEDYGTQAERASYEALLACEGFTLGVPAASRAVLGRLRDVRPFPPLDEELRLLATVLPGWLGVQFQPVEGNVRKVLGVEVGAVAVTRVEPGSPAAVAGIRIGDVILGPPNEHFREPQQIREWVMTSISGQARDLDMLRDGEIRTVSVRMTAPPEHSP